MDLIQGLLKLVYYAIGFGYSLIIAGLLIWRTHEYLYLKFHEGKSIGWRSSITGLVERGLYTGALLANFPAFVAIWLTLKSVAHWERFKADAEAERQKSGAKPETIIEDATAKFNSYFVGTGLSIAYGFTGALVTKLFINCQCISAIVVMAALAGAQLLLNRHIYRKAMDEKIKKKDATQLTLGDE